MLLRNTDRAYNLGRSTMFVEPAATIYEGSAVGDSSGYARALVAGDRFCGFALDLVVGAADGSSVVDLASKGAVELAVDSVAITDIGKAVYASDDGTFSLTSGSDSYVGVVFRFVSAGYALVKFNANHKAGVIALASVGNTQSGDVSAAINANFAAIKKLL